MPPKTPRQQRFMGSDLARARAGKKTRTGMSESQLKDFATKPKGGYAGKKQNGNGNGNRTRRNR
jgi:hypothetical protein